MSPIQWTHTNSALRQWQNRKKEPERKLGSAFTIGKFSPPPPLHLTIRRFVRMNLLNVFVCVCVSLCLCYLCLWVTICDFESESMPPTIMTIMGPTQPSLPPPLCAASAAASMAALCFDFCSVCSPHFSSFLSLCSPFFPPSASSSVAFSCSVCSFCSSSSIFFQFLLLLSWKKQIKSKWWWWWLYVFVCL